MQLLGDRCSALLGGPGLGAFHLGAQRLCQRAREGWTAGEAALPLGRHGARKAKVLRWMDTVCYGFIQEFRGFSQKAPEAPPLNAVSVDLCMLEVWNA